MSKYIDLTERVKRGHGDDEVRRGIDYALEWLDKHPERVPGRTITESEYRHAMLAATDTEDFDAEELLRRLGLTVIPDPAQTNAEKLADILQVAMQEDGWGDEDEANILAAALEAAGVKAMGADDEHS